MNAILKDTRTTTIVNLEDTEGGEVEVYQSLSAADIERMVKAGDETGIILPLTVVIKGWNLTDENGKALPVTPEHIGKLSAKDATSIMLATGVQGISDNPDFLGKGRSGTSSSKKPQSA